MNLKATEEPKLKPTAAKSLWKKEKEMEASSKLVI